MAGAGAGAAGAASSGAGWAAAADGILNFVMGLINLFTGIGVRKKERKLGYTSDTLDFGRSLVAAELQDKYNRSAARFNYELETNYQDRMNKLMNTGMTSWKAADILGGVNSSYSPPSLSVNQVGDHRPSMDLQGAMNNLMAVPQSAGRMLDRKLQKEQQKIDNEFRERELEVRKKAVEIQEKLANNTITVSQAHEEIYNSVNSLMVPNPVDPEGEKVPIFMAAALIDIYNGYEGYKQNKTKTEMDNEQLKEFKEEVKRQAARWPYELRALADKEKITKEEYDKLVYVNRILERESGDDWLQLRYDIMNAKKLSEEEGHQVELLIDGLDCDKDTKSILKVAFYIMKNLFGK